MPGSVLPDRNSSAAPPPVEICEKDDSIPNCLTAAAESPPPTTVKALPGVAIALATASVPPVNRRSSNLPIGPFQRIVLALPISALNAAAMRGVEVDIFLPEQSDLPHLHWAAFAQLWQVLEHGCRVWMSPGPFDHSKLMVVDGAWTLLGSANWDARSLRLNFEFNVECYDTELGKQLETLAYARRGAGRELTLAEVNARPLPIKLRDGLVRLFAPYL